MNRPDWASLCWTALALPLALGCKQILDIRDGAPLLGAGGAAGSADAGAVINHRSCVGLAETCGPTGDADCCESQLVPDGTFLRSYDGVTYDDDGHEAAISAFVLDRYEVTVGRFRKFVEAYPGSKPAAGSGRNPNNAADPGWDITWSDTTSAQFAIEHLPRVAGEIESLLECFEGTWTEDAGPNENLPINCVNWYIAFAFCIWDGGRLPTEAEWNFAAAGGDEQRVYPWGSEPPNDTYAVACSGSATDGGGGAGSTSPGAAGFGAFPAGAASFGGAPALPAPPCSPGHHPERVGSRSERGDALWEHADLAGNVSEWTLDQYFPEYTQTNCINCSTLASSSFRVVRGGSYADDASKLAASYREPVIEPHHIGLRCARSVDQER